MTIYIPTITITDNPYQENKNLIFESKNIEEAKFNWDYIFNLAKNNEDLAIEIKGPNCTGKLTSYICDTYYKFIDFIIFGYDTVGTLRLTKDGTNYFKIDYVQMK